MLALFAAAVLAGSPSHPAMSSTAMSSWFIDDDAAGPGTGTMADPFPTIQAALDAATTQPGDRLLVQEGVYPDPFVVDGLAVEIAAAAGAGLVELFRDDLDTDLVTIRNVQGGEVTFRGLEISSRASFNGTALFGSGRLIEIEGAEVTFEDCSILRTGTGANSGALRASSGSSITMRGCLVAMNDAGEFAAGLSLFDSEALISDTEFRDNPSATSSFTFQGGAIYFTGDADDVLTVNDCLFTGNNSVEGSGAKIAGDATSLFRHCQFIDNGDAFNNQTGGALSGRGVIESCFFRRNTAREGGAVNGAWRISDSTFELNTGADGEDYATAVEGRGSSVLTDCVIRNHSGVSFDPFRSCSSVVGATVVRCRFENNFTWIPSFSAGMSGGAISDCVAIDCVFVGNETAGPASSSVIIPRGGAAVRSQLFGCVLVGNRAKEGGATFDCGVVSCTIVDNVASTAGATLDSTLNSCILRGNVQPSVIGGPVVYSNVEGILSGTGNFDADPRFFGPESQDFNLRPDSPCIDAGDPALFDADGSRRDMGALPFDPGYVGAPTAFCATGADGAGCVPSLEAADQPSLTSGFELSAVGLRDASLSLVFLGARASNVPYLNGQLCLGGSLQRGPIGIFQPGAGPCENAATFSIPSTTLMDAGFQPGALIYAQVVYRDMVGGAPATAITGALEALVLP